MSSKKSDKILSDLDRSKTDEEIEDAYRQAMKALSFIVNESDEKGIQTASQAAMKEIRGVESERRKSTARVGKLEEQLASLREKHQEDTQGLKQELKAIIRQQKDEMRQMRDATLGQYRKLAQKAKEELEQSPVHRSYGWKTDQRKVAQLGRQADAALVKGEMAKALSYKREQLYHAHLARYGVELSNQVEKKNKKLIERLKRITRKEAPVKLGTQERYLIHYALYQMGLTEVVPMEPTEGFNIKAIEALFNLDVALDTELATGVNTLPETLTKLMHEKRIPNRWRMMSYAEYEEVTSVLDAVYRAGRTKITGNTIYTMDGKKVTIDDAAADLQWDLFNRFQPNVKDMRALQQEMSKIDGLKEVVGNFFNQLIKPETVLKRLDGGKKDGVWQRYIFNPIAEASNKQREMNEEAMRKWQQLLGLYTSKEWRKIRNDRIYQVGSHRWTKEEILCAALNWGAKENRHRAMLTLRIESQEEMEAFFSTVMTDTDWDFVEGVWKWIDRYYCFASVLFGLKVE